jgi:arylsulfatase
MRADAMGCAGHPCVRTPNLDRLADDGVRFVNAYTPDPICVPARASFTTGNYPHKCTGSKSNSGRILDDQIKIAELFSQNGYVSYASGKLHYVPYSPPGTPRLLHGFDHAVLHESGRIIKSFDPTGNTPGLEDYHDYLKTVGWGGYERAHGVGNNDIHPAPSPVPEEHYVDTWICDEAMAFLEQHGRDHADKPFFMFMSSPKPHAPYDPPRPYDTMYNPRDVPPPFRAEEQGKPRRTPTKFREMITHGWDLWPPQCHQVARAYYLGQITLQDKQIGRMLSFLDERGALENTIVVYTADHGDLMGDFGFFAKCAFYKGSANIPFIISWPKILRKGTIADQLVGLQDLLPTLASLAGLHLPREVDGIDLSPLLRGEEFTEREFIVSYCLSDPTQLYMIADKRFKYAYSQAGGTEELYDLLKDPDELLNVVGDPGTDETIQTMRKRLANWARENDELSILDGDELKRNDDNETANVEFLPSTMGWRWF